MTTSCDKNPQVADGSPEMIMHNGQLVSVNPYCQYLGKRHELNPDQGP